MHPLMTETFVQLHIEDLHREAAQRRVARSSRKAQIQRRKSPSPRFQRAPAH
jgi:hypothetical protein